VQGAIEGDLKNFLGDTSVSLVPKPRDQPQLQHHRGKAGIMLDTTVWKVVAWYDNELGYSCSGVGLIKHMAEGQWGRPLGSGTGGEGGERRLRHQEGLDDHSPGHDGIAAIGGWLGRGRLARRLSGMAFRLPPLMSPSST